MHVRSEVFDGVKDRPEFERIRVQDIAHAESCRGDVWLDHDAWEVECLTPEHFADRRRLLAQIPVPCRLLIREHHSWTCVQCGAFEEYILWRATVRVARSPLVTESVTAYFPTLEAH